jgi:hypothetical protein
MLTPKNWHLFQHYKLRRPPWIRLHRSLLDDYDFRCLPVASRALAPLLWLVASEYEDGVIALARDALAYRLHIASDELAEALNPLIQCGLFIDSEHQASTTIAPSKHNDSAVLAPRKQSATTEKSRDRVEKRRVSSEIENQFDQFWQAYPSRGKADNPKKPARTSFERAIRNGATAEAIIDGARIFASNPASKPGTEFVPMAATWLNQNRWQDAPTSAPNPYTAMSRAPLPIPTDPHMALVYKLGMQGINRRSDQQGVPRNYPPENDDEWLTLLQGWQVGIIGHKGTSWPGYAGGRGSEPDKAACLAPRNLFEQLGLEPPPPTHPVERPGGGNGQPKQPPSPDQQRELADGVRAGALVLDGPPPGHPGSLISAAIAREKGLIP